MKTNRWLVFLAGALVAAGFSGCAISKSVHAVERGNAIQTIYVAHNPRTLMNGFEPELVTQLKGLGFDAKVYENERPKEARHYLTYTANWTWDMAMYLNYLRATLYDEGRVLGEIEYDAKLGGANMGKFGKTEGKIRPLLMELLANAERAPKGATATVAGKP